MRPAPGVAGTFLRWTCLRAVVHRGYVLTSGLYFVDDARLTAAQIVLLGAVVSATLTLTDIPAGAWSDAFSRKWPLVAGHGFLAAGMVMTGAVTAFPLLACTQVLWGLGWACSGGADVAWLTDEMARPERMDRVLAARARWELRRGSRPGLVRDHRLGGGTARGDRDERRRDGGARAVRRGMVLRGQFQARPPASPVRGPLYSP